MCQQQINQTHDVTACGVENQTGRQRPLSTRTVHRCVCVRIVMCRCVFVRAHIWLVDEVGEGKETSN